MNTAQGKLNRKESRYRNRVWKRLQKRKLLNADLSDYDKVFSFRNLYKSYRKCIKGVKWKQSVSRFRSRFLRHLYWIYKSLKARRPRIGVPFKFYVFERGKRRDIQSIEIRERIARKCLCDYSLIPALSRTFIWDNGASLKGKGTGHSIKRIKTHLVRFLKNHKLEDGWIGFFDFKGFFKNIWHCEVISQLKKNIFSEDIIELTKKYMGEYSEEKDEDKRIGLGLGGQDSQVLALCSANRLDHFIKSLGIKPFARYMDDGYLITDSKEKLIVVMNKIKEKCKELRITLNMKKTVIQRLSKPFIYLKKKFHISRTNKITLTSCRSSNVRMRRRLKKFQKMVELGKMKFRDVWNSLQAWMGSLKGLNAYKTKQSIFNLFNRLFIKEWRYEVCIN